MQEISYTRRERRRNSVHAGYFLSMQGVDLAYVYNSDMIVNELERNIFDVIFHMTGYKEL